MSRHCASERGMALLESLIAVAVLGISVVVFLGGLSTGALSTNHSDRLSTAHELARSQMEQTKAEPYAAAPHSYPPVPAPPGYSVSSDASAIPSADARLQLITVQVSDASGVLYTLEGYKADR